MSTSKTPWKKWGGRSTWAACAAALLCVLSVLPGAVGGELSVSAHVESQEVFLGEPFALQVRVSGVDAPGKPDLSNLTDFTVRERGASRSGQRSFTIIVNGRQVKNESGSETTFLYELVAKKNGVLTIPPISVSDQGKTAQSAPLQIRVNSAAETPDLKFRLSLSRTRCFVGEPVVLRMVWYVGTTVRNDYQLAVPVLGSDAFAFADPRYDGYSPIQLAEGTVAMSQGKGVLDGREYITVTFAKVLIPKRPGRFEIPPATVVCAVLAGRQKQSSPFGDDFPLFNSMRDVYKKAVVPSDGAFLEVMPVPQEGRPADFAGHIGEYRISASATPVEVNVGDPITLTIALSGPEYLDNVELPPLGQQPALARDFKIPTEIAAGKLAGGAKVFTQSIRALREDVKSIPPIELPYFDTASGKYGIAKSAPIPLKVRPTRVITPGMVEGGQSVIAGSALEAWGKGIAHNYEGPAVLFDQRSGPAEWIRSPLWLAGLSFPPLLYALIFGLTAAIRRRNADPLSQKARKAFSQFARVCSKAAAKDGKASHVLLDAMREYLGSKLKIPSAAISFKDVEPLLSARGVDQDTMARLRLFFERCEAENYAGGSGEAADKSAIIDDALRIAGGIERKLR